MTLADPRILHPAPVLEARALAMAGAQKPATVIHMSLVLQLAQGETFGFRPVPGGPLAGVIGFFPDRATPGLDWIFILVAPALARKHLAALVKAARLTLPARAQNGVSVFRAEIVRGGPGERLAALLGLAPRADAPPDAPTRIWELAWERS